MAHNEFLINLEKWCVEKIGVIGPGIVGMPMAAMLANARIKIGSEKPAKVLIVQRNSPTSGWKVNAINSGRSVIGGIEPDLDRIVRETVAEDLLSATHDISQLSDADVILVCIQTDKDGFGPDYGPMFAGLTGLAHALLNKPKSKIPLLIFESTLAPSSMSSLIQEHFARFGLKEGKDLLLGNSPNRVMPGRLVERVADSDKLIGGLNPVTSVLIKRLYQSIVTKGTLHCTNSLTAEVVKTLENAYRDVRIAYSAEIVRYCDACGIDFYPVRDRVNQLLAQSDMATNDPNAVPSGGMLIPAVGVGGHCLPKDGILLLWRQIENGSDMSNSLILESRRINDASPAITIQAAENAFGSLYGKTVALMGVAYRFNSEDTRNTPTLELAKLLLQHGVEVVLHDPYVKPDDQKLMAFELEGRYTRNLGQALAQAEVAVFCTAHKDYAENLVSIIEAAPKVTGVFDGCNLYRRSDFNGYKIGYAGIGRGQKTADQAFVDFVVAGFHAMERGVANELKVFIDLANQRYAKDDFNRIDFDEVRCISGTCVTGCAIVEPGPIDNIQPFNGFLPKLVQCAIRAYSSC